MPAYAAFAGVRFDRIFREADAIIEAYTVGEPLARRLYGPDVRYGGPGWAGISYGHVNCLGAPLRFPEDSEVAHEPIYASLDQAISALQREVDWASAGLMPFYLELWEVLKQAFPEHNIPFGGFGLEGPITTAWEVRGHGFWLDTYDEPERCRTFLSLLTESILGYAAFLRTVNGQTRLAARVGLYDDLSSLIHPSRWPELVLPYHEVFFSEQTRGWRHAHIENLVPDHLPYLDVLRLDSFDPSVVTRVTPEDLSERCQVPFWWRLNSMHVRDLPCDEIRRFVFHSVAAGASGVFSGVARTMTSPDDAQKIHAFIRAAKKVAQLLDQGCPRSELSDLV
jgi:hypothetical protein